ncbi:MAG: S41 family peptidase [Terracidiphilus sp.]
MRRTNLLACIGCACSLLICGVDGQTVSPAPKQDSAPVKAGGGNDVFDFESDSAGSAPAGWWGGPSGTVQVDGGVAHSGQRSVRIEPKAEGDRTFSTLTKTLPMDFSGDNIEWRGFLKTEDVSGFAGLWMREDKDGAAAEFDNMQKRNINGTTGWTEYSITLPVHAGAQRLVVGALVSGTGKAWVDDLELLVDGKPISQAPKVEVAKSVLDSDHQFDGGSGVTLSELTPIQIENLALLGKVWGFLKYYHPRVTAGKLQWDYELFRILPAVLAAPDRVSLRAVLLKWIDGLGPVEACKRCETLDLVDLELRPDLDWIGDQVLLGSDLSKALLSIQQNRANANQFYVSLAPGVGNPSFEHELSYGNIKYPDAGFQILALFRLWNMIEYWAPYRDIVGEDWNGVLREFLPRIALAKTSDEYQRELMALIAMIHDTHANLWSSLKVRPPVGECRLPLSMRFIGTSAVVTGFASADAGAKSGIKVGDVVTDLDGQPVDKLVASWTPYYADSNEAARLRDIARTMTSGACGAVTVGVRRGNDPVTVQAQRLPATGMGPVSFTHDLPGDTFRLLSPDVAYLKLSSVKAAEIDHYLTLAAKTRGLIVDIRNYPSEFVVFALGSHFVDKSREFVKFTNGDLSNPGAFHWGVPLSLTPASPHYEGKIVVLVDEVTQSQAEYTTMAFRASPQTVVVGSTTAGADGNVSSIPLPGGFHSQISGIGVFYPDGKPTQQIGIVPDKTVRPTVEGIRDGRDEVLEEGVRQILGKDAPEDLVRKVAKP